MDKVKVTNTNNGKTVEAEVLQRSDKRLRVVLVGSNITLTLTREDSRRAYVGNLNGLEFTTLG